MCDGGPKRHQCSWFRVIDPAFSPQEVSFTTTLQGTGEHRPHKGKPFDSLAAISKSLIRLLTPPTGKSSDFLNCTDQFQGIRDFEVYYMKKLVQWFSTVIRLLTVLSIFASVQAYGQTHRKSAQPRSRIPATRKVSGRASRSVSAPNPSRHLNRQTRAAEIRRLRLEEARRRAEAARQAAIARQRAIDAAMRNDVQALIARDDLTGQDEQVRRVALNALGNHAGTVVVMDPRTGRVFAMINQEWAMRRGFKPCSTIKLVTGVAGLNERVIDPLTMNTASSSSHLNLTDALAYSNNTYFQQVGGQVGFDKMVSYARQLGLGQKTGINSPNEFAGSVPVFKSGFAVNHMSSHGDNFQVTALQLATLVSALANGGKVLTPYLPRDSQEESRRKPRVRRELNVEPETLSRMVPGMVGSVNYGSGRRAYNTQETVAGKTGTCIGDGGWVGLFTSYAPLTNARLAVVVIAQGTDAHGHFPAAVAGQIYRELSSRFGTPTNLQIANRNDSGRQRPASDPKAALDQEDAEADEVENRNTVRQVLLPVPSGNAKVVRPITDLKTAPKQAWAPNERPRRVTNKQP
jgi:membrane peptidoglycan carboxypeptidase